MKTPVFPPGFDTLLRSVFEKNPNVFMRLLKAGSPTDQKGRYSHGDKLRHLLLPLKFLMARNGGFALNFRQLALLRHALKHPHFSHVVQEHQRSHSISYDVACKDLLEMADHLKLLIKRPNRENGIILLFPVTLSKE